MEITVRTPVSRFVLVHYHICKNAGTTVEWILRRQFAGDLATLHSSDESSTLDGDHLKEFLQHNSRISAVSSHHLRYPKPEIVGTILFDCCFLRHPLDRLQSVYEHYRRTGGDDWLSRLARLEDSQAFIRTLVETAPHVVSNVQTLYLSNAGAFTRPATEWDLEKAVAILSQMAFPGVVERFDESVVAAEYFLRPAFPKLRLEYIAQNVSRKADGALAGAAKNRLARLWGKELHSQLMRLNEYDLKLWKRAADEIERRTALIPRFPALFRQFRQRCTALGSLRSGNFEAQAAQAAALT
jgi:hypothetical protein